MTYFLRYLGAMVFILIVGGIVRRLIELTTVGAAISAYCTKHPTFNDVLGWSWIALLLLGPIAITPDDE